MRFGIRFICCLSIGWAATLSAEELPLAFSLNKPEVSLAGGAARVPFKFHQQDSGAVSMEAEDATELRFEGIAGAGCMADEKASGSICITGVENAKFTFAIRKAGDYRIWMRSKFPWFGNWNHFEKMDGRQTLNAKNSKYHDDLVTYDANDPRLNTWIWIKGSLHTFTEGEHVFEFAYKGGCRLDKVVVLPEGAAEPADLGPEPAALEKPFSVTVEGIPFSGISQALPIRIGGTILPRGGELRCELSSEEGRWQEMKADSQFSPSNPVKTLGSRISFTINKETSPIWLKPAVVFEQAKTEPEISCTQPLTMGAVPLFPLQMVGVQLKKGSIYEGCPEAYSPDADGSFYVEAEAPQARIFTRSERAQVVQDATASGGAFCRSTPSRFLFSLPEGRSYQLWIRARKKFVRKNEPGLTVDGGWEFSKIAKGKVEASDLYRPSGTQVLSLVFAPSSPEADKPGEWLWLNAAAQDFTKGTHALDISGWDETADVDRFALLSAGKKPEDSKAASKLAKLSSGSVTFSDISVPAGLTVASVSPSGNWLVSVDVGKTFVPVAERGKLPSLPENASMQLKAVLNAGEILSNPTVSFSSPRKIVALENDAIRVCFRQGDGMPSGIYNKRSGQWVTPCLDTGANIVISYEVPGEGCTRIVEIPSSTALSFTQKDGEISAKYKLFSGLLGLELRYRLPSGDGFCSLEMSVGNKSPYILRELSFLNFPRLRVANDPMRETIAWPSTYGLLSQWPTAGSNAIFVRYPGTASTSFCALEGDDSVFYMSERNTDMAYYSMRPNIVQPFDVMGIHTNKSIAIAPGADWVGNYVFGMLNGTWHAAADLHRAWLRTWLPPHYNLAWLKDCDGFNMSNNVPFLSQTADTMGLLNSYFDCRYNQIWGWTGDGSYVGAYPIPDPRRGSKEQIKKSFDEFLKQGNHIGFYANVQEWKDDFDKIGGLCPLDFMPADLRKQVHAKELYDHAIQHGMDGGEQVVPVYLPQAGGSVEMCVGTKEWQEHLAHWIGDIWVKEYGVSGQYIDQTGCIYQSCFAANHLHGVQHAVAGKSIVETVRKVAERARTTNPDFVLGGEGIIDALTPYQNYGLWVGSPYCTGEFFKYLIPEIQLTRQTANNGGSRYNNSDNRPTVDHIRDISLFNWYESPFEPGAEQIIKVRRIIRPFVNGGTFMASKGLELDLWGNACWFVRDNSDCHALAVNIHNPTGDKNGKVRLKGISFKESPRAFAVVEGGKISSISSEFKEGALSFAVPQEPFSSVVVADTVAPSESLLIFAECQYDIKGDRLNVQIANLANKSQSLKINFPDCPAELKIIPATAEATIAAGETKTISFELKGIESLPWWLKQRVHVEAGKASFEASALIATTMVNGSLSKDANNDKHPDGWGIVPNVNFIMSNQVKDIQCVTGELVDNSERGKTVLELAEPMTQYDLKVGEGEAGRPLAVPAAYKPNRTITTPVILRPDTHYLLRFSARGTAGNVGVNIPGIFSKSEKSPVDKWAEIKMEFDTPLKLNSNLSYFSLTNSGTGKIWLDAVSLEYSQKKVPAGK